MDWISERNVHDWLHDAVHGLHIGVGWLHDFLVAWGIFIFLGLLCWLTWKFISMMPNVRPKQLDARAESDVRWDEVAGVEEVRAELEEVVEFLTFEAHLAEGHKGRADAFGHFDEIFPRVRISFAFPND